ncbi:hypothetical protein B5807_02454 [Epicoccum nigrum]|uniref:Protein kinase domain-containing protein n=1 Tax=Epicoccum nigrum TaxID=105696 RepID=A0A1Y2M8Q8_EPING|nr:hypothetical protein B5807_02454 [Epicoccum nigrum]
MTSILFTSALGASIKRQNDIPDCINGDSSTIDMPAEALALLSLPITIQAQGSDSLNLNLILRFSTASQDDSCGFSATRRAPTFTTASIPILPVCFDLADLFGGNATSGFVNQTGNQPAVAGEKGLHWSILNADEYDASANYSSVMYRQHLLNPNTDDQKPGHPARRRATLYPGKGCTEKDPNDENVVSDAVLFEEEQLEEFHRDVYYLVNSGDVFASKYQVVGELGFGLTRHTYTTLKVFTREGMDEEEYKMYDILNKDIKADNILIEIEDQGISKAFVDVEMTSHSTRKL